MKLSDFVKVIFIFIMFMIFHSYISMISNIKKVKENWPMYRCNPAVMPFASFFGEDAMDNFNYCMTDMQKGSITEMLQPITYNVDLMSSFSSNFATGLNSSREVMSDMKSGIFSIVEYVYKMFSAIVIQFQKIGIALKDVVGKFSALLVAVLYLTDGSLKTMESAWKGPPGQAIRAVGKFRMPGGCFHANTLIKLEDGTNKRIKDIKIGDILLNNTYVYATMIIKNIDHQDNYLNKMYLLPGNITVSESHLIQLPDKRWCQIKDHNDAKLISTNYDTLYCLITNNHTIPIGNYLFGDWEDDGLLPDIIKYENKTTIYN
jgi:hypothetical protein